MTYIHICTTDSMMVDAFEHKEKSICPICCKITKHRSGYIGTQCLECRSMWDFEDFAGSICMRRRHLLGLNRKEMSSLTGYSPKTIKQYEWVKCSKEYYEKTEKIMKAWYENKEQREKRWDSRETI